MTSIQLVHVFAPGCHPQGVFFNRVIQVQHTDLSTDCPYRDL